MERLGLVGHVEQQLEQTISLGLLPASGVLPSENKLARHYGVSRATARQALQRLAARGLVEQHPGRRHRAAVLDEAVTLENVGVALHEARGRAHPERRRLLEGYLTLRRETLVELLATCCEHASDPDMDRLREACFAVQDAAGWQAENWGWLPWEFELLRLAARAVDRPGHLLLIHSLERSFKAMAAKLLPHLDAAAARKWARCAFDALVDRDAQKLRSELPSLLKVGDDRLLDALAPVHQVIVSPEAPDASDAPSSEWSAEPESARDELPGVASADRSACHTGLSCSPPPAALPPESPHVLTEPLTWPNPEPGSYREGPPGAVRANQSACHAGSAQPSPTASAPELSACHTGSVPPPLTAGAPELSACHTGSVRVPPEGGSTPAFRGSGFGPSSDDRGMELSCRRAARGSFSWSPVPWPPTASPHASPGSAPLRLGPDWSLW